LNFDRRDTDTYLNEFDGPVRPAVFPWQDLVGYTFYRPIDDFVDAEGNPVEVDLEALGLQEGVKITQEIVNQLQAAGVDISQVKAAIKDYQMHHRLGLYKWLPMFNDTQHRQIDLLSMNLTHRLSSRMFYEVRAAYHRNRFSNYLYEEQLNADDPLRFARGWRWGD